MMISYYKLDDLNNVILCTSEEALHAYEKTRIVKQTLINGFKVSTIFLFSNHGLINSKPIVFETMIFDQEENLFQDYQERYCTYEEALKGHRKAKLELIKFITSHSEWALEIKELESKK